MSGDLESSVERHYARDDLEATILAALSAAGKDIAHLRCADLAPVDEFHSGGRRATEELAAQLATNSTQHLLDIGCGIGGPSRFFAEKFGCRVTGIDLAADYVRTATSLARRVGLDHLVTYRRASALALPFAGAAFDGAYMMHVGMNIADKPGLFAEIRRVLKRGAMFAVYDIMRAGAGEIAYPVHWAPGPETSFLATPAEYHEALARAGFEISGERNRRDFALEFFRQAQARAGAAPPPLGIHLLLKTAAPQKLTNMIDNLASGRIAPVELIARAR